MNGTKGGARPGAGRPRKLDKYAGQVAAAETRIADRLPELVEALMLLALGEMGPPDKAGLRPVLVPPDFKAASYLVDRLLGKPGQAIALEDGDGGPLRIVVEYVDDARGRHPPAPPAPEAEGDR